MKVILRAHVDHLGERGDVVNVAAGYARNYLLPKGLAFAATAGNLKQLEHQRRSWTTREAKEANAAQDLAARLEVMELSVARKAGESGTLYGSVTNADLAELLAAQGFEIDRKSIVLQEPIKALGTFEVPVKLHRSVTARIKLEVVSDERAG